jgi:hypothetical protein
MPFKGFSTVPTITGVEELISVTISGTNNEIVAEPGTVNTAPTVTTFFGPSYSLSVEGIFSGTTPSGDITIDSKVFKVQNFTINEAGGDVKKVSITAQHSPDAA